MKLHTKKIVVLACVAAIALSANYAKAEEKPNPLRIKADARLEKNVLINSEKRDDISGLRASTSIIIRDARGNIIEERKNLRTDYRDMRKEFGSSSPMTRKALLASTSEMFKRFKDDRKEIMLKMRKDAFEIRKGALVQHLEFALENLENIAERIETRIEKLDDEGKDTAAAEAKFDIAVDKIAKARVAVDALASLDDDSANVTATTTAEVELSKPREIGDAAIKAVKEARDAFKEVIQEIVKLVGKGRLNATTTTTITN
mgnify:CR=1 FL=1